MALKKSLKLKLKKSTGSLIKPEETSSIETYVISINKDTETKTCTATMLKNGVKETIDWPFADEFLATISKTQDGVVTITDQKGTQTTFQTGGGSGGGVSQTYVDTQDQAVKNYADEQDQLVLDELNASITKEAETRSANDLSLSQAIDNEVQARQNADSTLQTNIESVADAKQDKLTAGENITIKDNVISATGGGSEPEQYLKTIAKTDEGVVTITDKQGVETSFQTGGEPVIVDTEMSSTSTNAVQNKVIKAYTDSTFVPIDTTSSNIVYGVGYYRKAKNYSLNNEAIRETIPIRDTTKNFKVGSPTENEHCVNLEYLNSFSADTKRFAYSKEYSGTSEVWKQEMEWYAPNKISWLVLDCGKEATDGSKPLYFRSDKVYWGNDRFEYSASATYYFCADFTWDGDTYRLVWDNGTCRLLSSHATKVMFAIGI